jgi:hypothetical protein
VVVAFASKSGLNPDCFVRNQIRIHLSWSPIAGSGGEKAAIGISLCPARANPIRWFPWRLDIAQSNHLLDVPRERQIERPR